MNPRKDQRKETTSFSLWTLACEVILQAKSLPQTLSGQARMHPQSKGDPVLGLHSCRALSPVPRPEHEGASRACHLKN
jgi:hypothetical protein